MKYLGTRAILSGIIFSLVCIAGIQAQDAADTPSAASLYNDGLEKAKAEDYVGALSLMEQAIEKAMEEENEQVINLAKKNGTVAAYKAGVTHMKAEAYDAAVDAFTKGIEFNPSSYAAYVGKAQALEAKGENVEAIKAFMKAGELAIESGKADKAEQFEKVASNMIVKALNDKDWENTKSYAAAFLSYKETADVHYYMGVALKEQGNPAEGVEHLARACEMETGDASKFYYIKAQAHEELGQKAEAISAYKQVTDEKFRESAQYKIEELGG